MALEAMAALKMTHTRMAHGAGSASDTGWCTDPHFTVLGVSEMLACCADPYHMVPDILSTRDAVQEHTSQSARAAEDTEDAAQTEIA